MSEKIPYYFDTPVPKYFRETGWFNNPNSILFITWAFSKCSLEKRTIVHDFTELTLQPFEFVTGLGKGCQECQLSEGAFKHQLKMLTKAGLLKKTTNSRANRFTAYVWVTARFIKTNNQPNAQLTTNSQPTEQPQSRRKKTISKESHPSSVPSSDDADGFDDSFKELKFLVNNSERVVKISDADLKECIRIKGSLQSVMVAIEYILRSPGRKKEIQNWPNAMATWEIKSTMKPRAKENEEMANRLVELYGNCLGWKCEIYRDTKKDQRGILFFSTASTGNPETYFFSFVEADFKEKCSKVIRDKKMQKARIPNS